MNKKLIIKLLLIAFLVKGVYFFGSYFIFNGPVAHLNTNIGFLTLDHDVEDHFKPLENWWNTGVYSDTLSTGKVVFAARPPGYAPFYLPLYVLTSPNTARSLFALLNLLLDVISCVFLFLFLFQLTKNKKIAWVSFLLYVILPFVSVYSNRGKSEPLSTVVIIISSYYFLEYYLKCKIRPLIMSSALFGLGILIRPANSIFSLIPLVLILWKHRQSYFLIFRNGIIFSLPLFIVVGSWVLRSSLKEGRFIPITDTHAFATPEVRMLFKFIHKINGDNQSWIPGSEAAWFAPKTSRNYDENNSIKESFDETTFTLNFTHDSLLALRSAYWNVIPDVDNLTKSDSLFLSKAIKYISIYKSERTIWHIIKTEIKIFSRIIFIKHPHGTMLQKSTFWFQLGKIYWLALYYLVLLGGLFGFVYSFIKKNRVIFFICASIIYFICFHSNIIGAIENRYLAAIMPFLAISAGYFYVILFDYFIKLRLIKRN